MDNRSFESGAAASPPAVPASPSVGHPTAGDPQTAVPATKPGPYWFYQIGEELRAILTAAGVTPDHTNLTQLLTAQQTLFSPRSAGAIQFCAMSTAPSGWLKANGAAVSRATYAGLFAAIGTVFGVGDGATTFNLPDLRGEFLRGWDDARGIDTGRAFGSAQADALQGHFHKSISSGDNTLGSTTGSSGPFFSVNNSASSAAQTFANAITGNPFTDGVNGTPRTAAETRARNIALLACIKY